MKTMSNYSTMSESKDSINGGKQIWVERLNAIIDTYIGDHTLDNERIAREMGVSERNLFRKLNELMGMPPQKYIRKRRMQRAMDNLKSGQYRTVNETGYSVGYLNVSYFINQFEKEFNVKPLLVLQKSGWR